MSVHEPSPTRTAPIVEFHGIEKSFFSAKVLKGVTFNVGAGRVLGLVGENGAGKSTLMNILGGNLEPDGGTMVFAGAAYRPKGPQDAARRGIAFIHQELNLFPNLDIAENLFLTKFPRLGWLIRRREIERRTAALLEEVGLQLPPKRLVETLSAGERQLVEIAKALSSDAALIIFDEPTTSLGQRETERLFELMARLRARGLAMIYISHTLADIFRLCDDIVVLRDGAVVGTGAAGDFTTGKLVSLMVGRTMSQLFPERRGMGGAGDSPAVPRLSTVQATTPSDADRSPLLEARGLSQPGVVENVSFALHRGEVLGLAGLMGAGRSELARILFGLDPRQGGEVRLNGEALHRLSPRQLIERGVVFLTENRRSEGLCLDGAVADNLSLATLPNYTRWPLRWLSRDSLQMAVTRIRRVVKLDPKTNDQQPVRTLSGGNQQKVVLGKWLLREPLVLLLDEPTRGIDVGAKFDIYQLIHDRADSGAGVLVISSEMEELLGLCDRILVMRGGRLVDNLPRGQFDQERILRSALGTTQEPRQLTSDRREEEGARRAGEKARSGIGNRILPRLLEVAPLLLFVALLAFFGVRSAKFLDLHNLLNIVVQASSTGIVAVGMTFVLLTAGVDLSVGAMMFVGAAVAGKMALAGWPLPFALLAMVALGFGFGAFNAFFVTRVRVAAFIVTLAVLFIGRGLGLRITETRAMNLPDSFLDLGSARWLSVPLPAWLFAGVLVIGHLVLTRTPFGRQIFAIGHDREMAKLAGIRTERILAFVYLISGLCAAVAAMITLGQLGAVSPKFGEGKEFAAIAAAVLGGTSLFGGRGNLLPGTLLGALLIQTIENGLVIVNANPYLYPMITSAVIFVAVWLESLRHRARGGQGRH